MDHHRQCCHLCARVYERASVFTATFVAVKKGISVSSVAWKNLKPHSSKMTFSMEALVFMAYCVCMCVSGIHGTFVSCTTHVYIFHVCIQYMSFVSAFFLSFFLNIHMWRCVWVDIDRGYFWQNGAAAPHCFPGTWQLLKPQGHSPPTPSRTVFEWK